MEEDQPAQPAPGLHVQQSGEYLAPVTGLHVSRASPGLHNEAVGSGTVLRVEPEIVPPTPGEVPLPLHLLSIGRQRTAQGRYGGVNQPSDPVAASQETCSEETFLRIQPGVGNGDVTGLRDAEGQPVHPFQDMGVNTFFL